MPERIVFRGKQDVVLASFKKDKCGKGQVRIRTRCSLMSTGTENIVLNQLFETGTGWAKWVKYPFHPGYAAVGTVVETGGGVDELKAGDRVVCRRGHAAEHVLPAAECFPVPRGIADEDASWFALAKIAAMGARTADVKLGDVVVIAGAGPVAQMAIRWTAAAGAGQIIVADPFARRLKFASLGGADHVLARGLGNAVPEIAALTGERMADIVIDTTGHPAVFGECFKVARSFGKIVLLGDTGTPSQQCLSHDLMGKGLTIVAAHDSHETEDWTSRKIIALFFRLATTGRFHLKGLVTHRFPPREFGAAYHLANTKRNETMGILFNWP